MPLVPASFSFPHPLNDDVDYHWACERCELLVRVTQGQDRRLCLLLRYDRRQKGARGLSLVAPFPELKLKAGDRFEPSSACRLSLLKACRCFSGGLIVLGAWLGALKQRVKFARC